MVEHVYRREEHVGFHSVISNPRGQILKTFLRLPGDVDRLNLEKHLSDADFDMVFRQAKDKKLPISL